MQTEEIRSIIHESVENIDDPELLGLVQEILQRKYSPESELVLTPDQIQKLNDAKAELDKGEFLSNVQANQLVEEWLNK